MNFYFCLNRDMVEGRQLKLSWFFSELRWRLDIYMFIPFMMKSTDIWHGFSGQRGSVTDLKICVHIILYNNINSIDVCIVSSRKLIPWEITHRFHDKMGSSEISPYVIDMPPASSVVWKQSHLAGPILMIFILPCSSYESDTSWHHSNWI